MFAGFDQICSESNGESIDNSTECIYAANEMGRNFSMVINNASFPTGCYIYWNDSENNSEPKELGYFNINKTNSMNFHGNPICARTNEGNIQKLS